MITNHENCIYCKSKNFKKLLGYEHAYLVKCIDCSLVFTSKIPTIDQLTKHYGNYPRFNSLSPITEKRYNELLDKFEKFRSTNNLIDLGCSNGLFLECAKKRGWNVYGTEYDPKCVEIGKLKDITIFKSDQLPKELFELKFDVVTSFEVIEHINNPLEEMEFVNKLVRTGGAVYITTPNFNSISRFYLRNNWNVIEFPEHLTYYTSKTLNKLLVSSGYQKDYLLTTGIAISRMRKSLGKSEPASIDEKSSDEKLREKIEKGGILNWIKNTINFILNSTKTGDAMKAFYIRK
jgi:2-polyprenyl-3-methyl-5-hydroxy-6-metoxy-1,4-benzoquinol methylase